MGPEEKRAFISYVREDSEQVDRLCKVLQAANVPYWRDRESLGPGDLWKTTIREAIQTDSMVFLACFSDQSRAKETSVMNEELWLASEQFRLRPPGRKYLFPIRFDAGEVPAWELGGTLTLRDVQYTDLFGDDYAAHAVELVEAIKSAMGRPGLDPATVRASVEEAADADRPAILRRLTKEMVRVPEREIELDALISQEVANVLAAIRDPQRFPKQLNPGTNDEQLLQLASLATDYWRLVEPFCWSLNIAARWADTTALTPWIKGLRAFCAEALKIEGGVLSTLTDLKHIPCLTSIFGAALSSSGQQSWANFKSLLVDTTVTNPRVSPATVMGPV